jgi:LPPG:FO 2-phospho-L-lactate transferase
MLGQLIVWLCRRQALRIEIPMGHILALAGGVGGAKLAFGLARILSPEALTIVVNTGDDDEFHGLHVSPDLDTVMYTLAGLANPETGWGLRDESFHALEQIERLGGETWFKIGDRDLATHIRRTELLCRGFSLSEVTAYLARHLGVANTIAPMTDDKVRTVVDTALGRLSFQEYFVKHACEPVIDALSFEGAAAASPSPPFADALRRADAVVICPSNPFLSIAPILAVGGVRDRLARGRPVAVVSPIIGGQAVKGPAAKLFQELGKEPASSLAVARYYQGIATHFVLDENDQELAGDIAHLGYAVSVEQTLMRTDDDKVRLARAVRSFIGVEE